MDRLVPFPRTLRRRGFTLLEILVAVGIIAILIGIIVPVVVRAKLTSKAVQCQANERTLWQAILSFAADHNNNLPGNSYDGNSTDGKYTGVHGPGTGDFLLGKDYQNGLDFTTGPQGGSLFPYVTNNYKSSSANATLNDPANPALLAYRCPAREVVTPVGQTRGSGVDASGATNGRFDYAMFQMFAGCPLRLLPTTTKVAQYTGPSFSSRSPYPSAATNVITIPTPILIEESAQTESNGANLEGGHSNEDQLAHAHQTTTATFAGSTAKTLGCSYYVTVDGSVQLFVEPPCTYANDYTAKAPSGMMRPIGANNDITLPGDPAVTFGAWVHQ